MDATHEEMEAKQAEADEAAQERAEQRREKEKRAPGKGKTAEKLRGGQDRRECAQADGTAPAGERRLQRENDDFAQRLG